MNVAMKISGLSDAGQKGGEVVLFQCRHGDILKMADEMGMIQNSYSYRPWGELHAQTVAMVKSYGFRGLE